jgi:hypothetical protein
MDSSDALRALQLNLAASPASLTGPYFPHGQRARTLEIAGPDPGSRTPLIWRRGQKLPEAA